MYAVCSLIVLSNTTSNALCSITAFVEMLPNPYVIGRYFNRLRLMKFNEILENDWCGACYYYGGSGGGDDGGGDGSGTCSGSDDSNGSGVGGGSSYGDDSGDMPVLFDERMWSS